MLRFDTLEKKPKVWSLAVLAVITLAAAAILMIRRSDVHLVLLPFCLFLAAAVVLLARAFVLQVRYNPYSYNTIYYSGFSLFFLSALILMILQFRSLQAADLPSEAEWFGPYLSLSSTGMNFLFLTSPFIFVFSAALFISNVSLIRHEGKRLVNVLGIVLALLLVGGILVLYALDYYATGSQNEVMIHDLLVNIATTFYLYFECMLIGTIISNLLAVRYRPDMDKDYLIILGCGLRKDGTPTPLLAGRIDRALRFAREQEAATGKAPVFVTSGGQGPREVISESASMTAYLLEKGVPAERILQEDRSTSTYENMLYSREVIRKAEEAAGRRADFKKPSQMGPEDRAPKIAFATTNYHVFRSGLMARRVHMRAVGIGAHTKWYFWPNAAVREFVGILTEHRLKQALIMGGMVLFYVLSTIAVYRL